MTFYADQVLGVQLSFARHDVKDQRARLDELMDARGSISRIIIKVGNSVDSVNSSRPSQTVYVRCTEFKAISRCKKGTFTGASRREKRIPRSKVIQKVSFNINPSYSKPTASMNRQMAKRGKYTLSRRLGFEFPCYCRVEFDDSLALPPVEIRYRTSLEQGGDAINVVIEYSAGRGGAGRRREDRLRKRRKAVVVDGEMDCRVRL